MCPECCPPRGADNRCTCEGCWACEGHAIDCTCDIGWDCEHDDNDLPGMWERADFLGGDPDTRSYAERARAAAATQISAPSPTAGE